MAWGNNMMLAMFFLTFATFEDVQSNTQVFQDTDHLTTESQNVTLKCNHTIKSYDNLIWYKHIHGLGLEICAYGYSQTTMLKPRYTMKIDKASLSTQLDIKNVKGEDTAVYYCAVRDGSGVNKLVFGQGTVLTVSPKKERTNHYVYQLKSYKAEEGLPDTVCLFTDFSSPNISLKVDKQNINLNEKAVLDRSNNDVWRYSAVIWDKEDPSKNLSCNVEYGGTTVKKENIIDETTATCSSLTISTRFHTNPGMNTLSVSVFGIKMLAAKAVIFNLILTTRLWSS